MKTRKVRLEFGVIRLADIRFLYLIWDRFWALEGGVPPYSVQIYVTIGERLPRERVNLNFQASPEVLNRFLEILEQNGLRFRCDELIPGFLIVCRVDKDRGGLTLIGGRDGIEPDNGAED
jgi:hypothetical protein